MIASHVRISEGSLPLCIFSLSLSLSLSLSTVRARSPTAPSLLYLRLSGGPLAEGLEIQKSPTQRERGGEISSRLASRIESVDDDARLRAEVAHETARGKNERV